MDHIIVDRIDRKTLEKHVDGDTILFSRKEFEIMSELAPHNVTGAPYSNIWKDKRLFYEMIAIAFRGTVTIEPSLIKTGADPELLEDKAATMNPILSVLGIDSVDVSDTIRGFVDLRMKGFEAFSKMTKDIPYQDMPLSMGNGHYSGLVHKMKDILGDFSAIIGFGSYFLENKYNDVDTRVIVPEISPGLYERIAGEKYQFVGVPLEIVMVPKEYQTAFDLVDPANTVSPGNSKMVHGVWSHPVTSQEHRNKLLQAAVAFDTYVSKKALTSQEIDDKMKILRRVNSLTKRHAYIARNINTVYGSKLREGKPSEFDTMPSRDDYKSAMVDANLKVTKNTEYMADVMQRQSQASQD